MSNDESDAAKCAGSIRALGELFSDPKSRAQVYHRYLLVERSSGQLVFEQEDFDFVFEQAVAKAFGRPKPRRRMIRSASSAPTAAKILRAAGDARARALISVAAL